MKTPLTFIRKTQTCSDWLLSLPADAVLHRWGKSGKNGFYLHERIEIARFHQDEGVLHMAREWLRNRDEIERIRQEEVAEQKRLQETERQERERQRQERLVKIRSDIKELDASTHGTIVGAAQYAAQLYLEYDYGFKQSIVIATNQYCVQYNNLLHYLAGAGIRLVWAKVSPDNVNAAGEIIWDKMAVHCPARYAGTFNNQRSCCNVLSESAFHDPICSFLQCPLINGE